MSTNWSTHSWSATYTQSHHRLHNGNMCLSLSIYILYIYAVVQNSSKRLNLWTFPSLPNEPPSRFSWQFSRRNLVHIPPPTMGWVGSIAVANCYDSLRGTSLIKQPRYMNLGLALPILGDIGRCPRFAPAAMNPSDKIRIRQNVLLTIGALTQQRHRRGRCRCTVTHRAPSTHPL